MRTDTAKKIIEYIQEKKLVTAKELVDILGISRQALHRQLNNLVAQNAIKKIGTAPKVFYTTQTEHKTHTITTIEEPKKQIIDENYLIITPQGEKIEGWDGFLYWCQRQHLPPQKTADEYIDVIKKYAVFKHNGIINGMQKLTSTFPDVYLDHFFYLDFYSIERFGKTKLGMLLLYAKQTQNKKLIEEIYTITKNRILTIISTYPIKAIGFIPPTISRTIQFQKELERLIMYDVLLPRIKITKITNEIAVAQKSLTKLEDRIENASHSIIVEEIKKYDTMLLIDDAVGSGATMNEVAKKIKERGIAQTIIGLAITGSFKGFDVIQEI